MLKKNIGIIFINPFYSYSMIYIFVTLVYLLPWSDMYPQLGRELLLFLFLTIIFSLYLAGQFKINSPMKINKSFCYKKYVYVMLLLLLCYGIDFVYMKSIPLFSPDPEGGFRVFEGIPMLHVLFVSFNGFYTSVVFERYLQSKENKYLYLWIFSFFPHVLLFTRGMVVVSLITSFLLFCFYENIKGKNVLKFSVAFIGLLYCFGVAGNIRTNQQMDGEMINESKQILSIGQATNNFKKSIIPNEFFWSYLYISSPLANLQNIIEVTDNYGKQDLVGLVIAEFFPDFISKRVIESNDMTIPLITPALNVCTFYAGSYLRLGWLGMTLMYAYYMFLTIIYCMIFMRKNRYRYIGVATFSTIVYLGIFSNIFVFSGWSLQLIYPIIFNCKFRL